MSLVAARMSESPGPVADGVVSAPGTGYRADSEGAGPEVDAIRIPSVVAT
jgi:hypothetical protein